MIKRLIITTNLMFILTGSLAQTGNVAFKQMDVRNGLSSNNIYCIYQDNQEFIWFGTASGLDRFDGYSIHTFRTDPNDSTSISNNGIQCILEDSNGNLWIGTEIGLNKFNRNTETFKRYRSETNNSTSLNFDFITSLFIDSRGRLFVGTGGAGVNMYLPETDNFARLTKINNYLAKHKANGINNIEEDDYGNIWISSNGKLLSKINPLTLEVEQSIQIGQEIEAIHQAFCSFNKHIIYGSSSGFYLYNIQKQVSREIYIPKNVSPKNATMLSASVDKNGFIWIGTLESGIYVINGNTFEFIANYRHNECNPGSLLPDDVMELYFDHMNRLWVGLRQSGISFYHPDIYKFEKITKNSCQSFNFKNEKINNIFEDYKKNIWFATENGLEKLYSYRKSVSSNFGSYKSKIYDSHSVLTIFEDHKHNLWTGNYQKGLGLYNSIQDRIIYYLPASSGQPAELNIASILEIRDGMLCLGTMGSNILLFDTKTKKFTASTFDFQINDFINDLQLSQSNELWVATEFGLHKISLKDTTHTFYANDQNDKTSLSNNHIYTIFEDQNKMIWIGTQEGLNVYNQATDNFIHIDQQMNVTNEAIVGIIEDELGRIWASTRKGIIRIDPVSTEPFKYHLQFYNQFDGVLEDGFRKNALFQIGSGEIIVGGNKGINIFNPDDIENSAFIPKVTLIGLYLFNKEVDINKKYNGNIILNKSVTQTQQVTIGHDQNVISFEFTALNTLIPEKCHYKYMLKEFDKNWAIISPDMRRITYTNLDPGEYRLLIHASNSDGKWTDNPFELLITVKPPFWKTTPALIIYTLILILLLLGLRRIVILSERKEQQSMLEHQEATRLREMDILKTRFFTNVSHEFRTPLTLIITPLDRILKNLKQEDLRPTLENVLLNSRRLLKLVNQLLDFRKLEITGITLKPSTGDIIKIIREVVFSFSDYAKQKQINYKFRSNIDNLVSRFDQDKIEKIIFNLLSNAFKYTDEKGEITLDVDYITQIDLVSVHQSHELGESPILRIKVKDTGIGIPKDKLAIIFERFTQLDKPGKIIERGSGIGLSLTQEYVKLHGGTIDVESEEGKGSCFTLQIPLRKISNEEPDETNIRIEPISEQRSEDIILETDKPVVLIVEDNEDLGFYLKDNLRNNYQIIEAENGKTGLKQARNEVPDLIISDIMMPEMDGIEMCKQIKENRNTCHIPIIILTAKSSEEEQLKSFNLGIDAFLTKPFSFELLEMRIKNLIKQRELLRGIFNSKLEIKPKDITITSLDEKLIKKALDVVEENISNSDFTVEQFGEELGMSRGHLYKKLLSITGKTPIEFIRVMRLKRAAQLLQKSQLRVSEVAYEVGFNNPKYFSKYFRAEFGELPSQYAAKYQ